MTRTIIRSFLFLPLCLMLSPGAVSAAGPEVEEASALLKQMHPDQCLKRNIQSHLLAAHQTHDQKVLQEYGGKLDDVNKRLKPQEDRLKALKEQIKKNAQDKLALESVEMSLGACE